METILIPDTQGGAEHEVDVFDAGVSQFVARLRKMYKQRAKWAKQQGVSCYRIYDADLPEYACAIDVYQAVSQQALSKGKSTLETYVHVAEYQAPKGVDPARAEQRITDVLTVIPDTLGIRVNAVFSKVRKQGKGGSQYAQAHERREAFVCYSQENGHRFELDLNSYLDTGLFLDHRDTRAMVEQLAAGKRVLNLFSYTGSASVYAAAGGATQVTTVDLSQTYLDWAKRNMALNGRVAAVAQANTEFVRSDTMVFLAQAARAHKAWDVAFVDPPTFSNSKAMGKRTWDVQRDHVALLKAVKRVMAPGGIIIFSNNLRTFKPDTEELECVGIHLQDISAQTIPVDFERNPKIHRCYQAVMQA